MIIRSGHIEEKIQNAYKEMEILDDLYEKMLRMIGEGLADEGPDTQEMLCEIRRMRSDTEIMYDLLKGFIGSIEELSHANQRKLDELKETVAGVFV